MSSNSSAERIRKAARDGYLDLLRDATRKECNSPDEDGMTATHWAAYAGNLDSLRIIVGRGGDPEKCDNFGKTALHWSANNGHFECVSFLVSFGVNLWLLDNNYNLAKENAAIQNQQKIVEYLDHVLARQSALNTKIVQKMKERALNTAKKRIKLLKKFQNKTAKQAEKEEKQRMKHLKQNFVNSSQEVYGLCNSESNIYDTINSKTLSHNNSTSHSSSIKKFSDLVNSSVKSSNKMKVLSGVSRKVLARKQNPIDSIRSSELKNTNETCRSINSIKSLVGIRRDEHIVYLPKFNSLSVNNLATFSSNGNENLFKNNIKIGQSLSRILLKDVFEDCETNIKNIIPNEKNKKASLSSKFLNFNKPHDSKKNHKDVSIERAISVPNFSIIDKEDCDGFDNDIVNLTNSTKDDSAISQIQASIFDRPGFGSVSFRGKFTPELLFSMSHYKQRADSAGNSEDDFDFGRENNKQYLSKKNSLFDHVSFTSDCSIGSLGSLDQPSEILDDRFDSYCDTENKSKLISVLLFLYAHGLKEYYEIFESEQIDIDALMLLSENDLISLEIPLGPRRKLLNAIRQRKKMLTVNNNMLKVFETKL